MVQGLIRGMCMIRDATGGTTNMTNGANIIVPMDTTVKNDSTAYCTPDLANDGIELERAGWYLVWGKLSLQFGAVPADPSYINFVCGVALGGTEVSHVKGGVGIMAYNVANFLVMQRASSVLCPYLIENTVANTLLTLRSYPVAGFTTATIASIQGEGGTPQGGLGSFLAAAYMGA